jgi:hypothetical protein
MHVHKKQIPRKSTSYKIGEAQFSRRTVGMRQDLHEYLFNGFVRL